MPLGGIDQFYGKIKCHPFGFEIEKQKEQKKTHYSDAVLPPDMQMHSKSTHIICSRSRLFSDLGQR